jgi:tRNA nucleotidyltransferase (CCA-adding enzyme)
MEIDFVHLRSEVYTTSRIPEVQSGSPEEDASRRYGSVLYCYFVFNVNLSFFTISRDFTINSLFYNLNERLIEDFTGEGIKDLKNSKENYLYSFCYYSYFS